MNENRLNSVKEITRHFWEILNYRTYVEERIQTWKCWQLNNVKGNVTIYKKRAHDYNTFSLLSYS